MSKQEEKDTFYILNEAYSHNLNIQKSRFITHVLPVDSENEAMEKIKSLREIKANHNCWAYRISPTEFRYSDDGEPSGTAGRPIFQVLEKHQMIRTLVLVIRYFGGVKLGTGGLIRAYSDCANTGLELAKKTEYIEYETLNINVPYDALRAFYYALEQGSAKKLQEQHLANGVKIKVKLEKKQKDDFIRQLKKLSAEKISVLDEN